MCCVIVVCWLFLLELRALQYAISYSSVLFVCLSVLRWFLTYSLAGSCLIRDTWQFVEILLNSSSLPTGVSCNLFTEWDPTFLVMFSWIVRKGVNVELEGSVRLRVESPRADQRARREGCRQHAEQGPRTRRASFTSGPSWVLSAVLVEVFLEIKNGILCYIRHLILSLLFSNTLWFAELLAWWLLSPDLEM